MAESSWLVDTNILLRFIKPEDRDYPLVRNALSWLWTSGAGLFYTSQNLAEFWNTCTRPAVRNGYGLSVVETDQRARLAAVMHVAGIAQILTFNGSDFVRYPGINAVHPAEVTGENRR